jgi:hypothetical protein
MGETSLPRRRDAEECDRCRSANRTQLLESSGYNRKAGIDVCEEGSVEYKDYLHKVPTIQTILRTSVSNVRRLPPSPCPLPSIRVNA